MNFQKPFNDLIVDLYSTNFENGSFKVNQLLESNPGILEDSDLRRKISLLTAECLEKQGDIKKALDLYLEIWEEYSVQTLGYLPVGLAITQLYLKLPDAQNAMLFAKQMLKAMEVQGFQNYDLGACISLLRIAFPSNEGDPTLQSFIVYMNKRLGTHIEHNAQSKELEEVENKLRQEGRILTQIMATVDSTSKEATIRSLEEFLESALDPTFRREASNYYQYLQKN
jgi:hypothetical protein